MRTSNLCILFGRPHRAPDADDRFELEALAAEELGIDSYALPLDAIVDGEPEQWHRACFVPADAGFDDFAAICERLLDVRGDRFERGFVVKKYLELATLPGWTPEQRRVTDEHRLVFWEGRLVAHAPYYDVDSTLAEPARFAFLGGVIPSPFFTADVARLAGGGYTVLEINDGGCSILPEQMDPRDLYRAMLG